MSNNYVNDKLARSYDIGKSWKDVYKIKQKERRTLRVMDDLEKNSFYKMFCEGWCSDCSFDSSKCAEQKMCEAYKIVNKVIEGGNDNEEIV